MRRRVTTNAVLVRVDSNIKRFAVDGKFHCLKNLQTLALHHEKEQTQDQMQSIQSNKNTSISTEIGDFVAVVYDPEKKVYIGEVIAMDDGEVHVFFLQHSRKLSLLSVLRQPQIADKVWVSRSNV